MQISVQSEWELDRVPEQRGDRGWVPRQIHEKSRDAQEPGRPNPVTKRIDRARATRQARTRSLFDAS
jgi:hypothetical protein